MINAFLFGTSLIGYRVLFMHFTFPLYVLILQIDSIPIFVRQIIDLLHFSEREQRVFVGGSYEKDVFKEVITEW